MSFLRAIINRGVGLRTGRRDAALAPIAARRPPTYDELILRALELRRGRSFAQIVDWAVAEAIRDEQARGGWSADVGIWGPTLIRRDLIARFHAMLGTSLVLEGEPEGPWIIAPAPTR